MFIVKNIVSKDETLEPSAGDSRENRTVVSHNNLVQDGTDHAPVDVNLLGSRSEHLKGQVRS